MEWTDFVEPIASTVIDLGLKAALLVAFTGLAIRLLTRRRPAWSCLLWSATLGAVALLPLGALLGPVLPWGQTPIPHFDQAWSLHTGPTLASLSPAAPITAGPAWWHWAVASLYLIGLAFALTRLGWGLWHLHRLRQSVHLVDAAPVEALRRQLGLHHPVQLGVSPLLQTPALLGWRRPTIALPAALYAQCTPGALRDIIVHELVHLKRRDPLLNMLSQGVVALYWFHPLVHWAAHSLVEMRECACDDWVVAQSGDPLTYAETLLHAAADQRPRLAMTMARSGRVAKRVERLLDPSHRPRPRVHGILGGGAVAMILTLAGCMGGLGRGGETSGPQVQRWIITPPASVAVDSVKVKQIAPLPTSVKLKGIIPLPASVKSVEIKRRVPLLPLLRGTVDSVNVKIHRDSTDVPPKISMQFPPHIRMQVTNPVDSVNVKVLGSRADTLKVFLQRPPHIRHLSVAAPVSFIMIKHLDDSAD
ncbi:MAG: M56 family metallopeptidase [Gemmatimonadetes bacterium]|nr:M56 family metallopeptidase [Gemmatimonadota bacterium]